MFDFINLWSWSLDVCEILRGVLIFLKNWLNPVQIEEMKPVYQQKECSNDLHCMVLPA